MKSRNFEHVYCPEGCEAVYFIRQDPVFQQHLSDIKMHVEIHLTRRCGTQQSHG